MKREYYVLWNWLLNKGIIKAAFIVNVFILSLFFVSMIALHFFVKWYDKFR